MEKLVSGRILFTIFLLVLVTLACNAPFGDQPTAEPVEEITAGVTDQEEPTQEPQADGYVEIRPDQPAALTTDDGATLNIPVGAYDEVTAVSIEALPDSVLPETTNLHHLISTPYELNQDGYAFQARPLELRIPFDPSILSDSVVPEELTIVWWDGESWQDVSSTVDLEQNEITAEINHFSVFAAASSRVQKMVNTPGYFNEEQVYGQFTIHFTTNAPADSSGFWPFSSTANDDRPLPGDLDDSGVPDFVEFLGEWLLQSSTFYNDYLNARGLIYPVHQLIDVFVADIEPAGGLYYPETTHIMLDNDRSDITTAAHELFHFIQHHYMPPEPDQNRWWIEAAAEWAEGQVVAGNTSYHGAIRRSMPNPPLEGYGRLHSRDYLEFYAGSSLAYFLEENYPDFVIRTFASPAGLNRSDPWYETFDRLLDSLYGVSFEEVMDEYFTSYFYHWDFDGAGPFIFDISDPALLADPLLVANPGMYTRVSQSLPPISGRLLSVESGADLEKATLVVAQGGQGESAFVFAFADNVNEGVHTRVILPGSGDRLGVIIGAASDILAVDNFGRAGSDLPINQVNLVASNPQPRADVGLDLEIYALDPPTDVFIEDPDADPLRIHWLPSRLPVGQDPRDDGALAGYALIRQYADSHDFWPLDDPTMTSLEISRDELGLDKGLLALTMRAIDKYGNESPDSNELTFGASLVKDSSTYSAGNCHGSFNNDDTYCDLEVTFIFSYSVTEVPSTLTCYIDSISTYAEELTEMSGTVQMDMFSKGANVTALGRTLRCEMLPDNIDLLIPFNDGNF